MSKKGKLVCIDCYKIKASLCNFNLAFAIKYGEFTLFSFYTTNEWPKSLSCSPLAFNSKQVPLLAMEFEF